MSSKNYAVTAGQKALQSYVDSLGLDAVASAGEVPGTYHISYASPTYRPSVSIIVTERKFGASFAKQLSEVTSIRISEILIPRSLSAIAQAAAEQPWVLVDDGASGAHYLNRCADIASGEVLCFLDPNLTWGRGDSLAELIARLRQEEIGIAGSKIVTSKGTISHAGYVLTPSDPYADPLRGHSSHYLGPFGWAIVGRDCSAVSIRAMAIRKAVWSEVGGLDAQTFPNIYSDADLCLRVKQMGYRVIWNAHCEFAEAKLNRETPREDQAEMLSRFRAKWHGVMQSDPHFSPNLSRNPCDFSFNFQPAT
jgi:hypothetical protein